MSDRTFERGSSIIDKLSHNGAKKVIDSHGDIAPDMAKYIVEFVFGEIYCRDGLDLKTKQIITITALSTLGFAKPQLEYHIKGALRLGISQTEIIDIITHVAPYAGFPAALTALSVAKEVFKEINKSNSINE